MASFGRYEIIDKLGEGAMGVVYRARDANLGRVVALKTLSTYLDADAELRHRFRREAEAIGCLNHPNIVSIYDLGEQDGQAYMAMELLEGEDLRVLIEGRDEVPLADRVRILVHIAQGLAYAHAHGVVHRDVKPANIFVTSTGRVKLLDFGLARLAASQAITREGLILGTPDYMSPEQATGRPIDHRTDIFSAGAVFYEFLSLRKPFPGSTLHSVLYKIVSESPPPLVAVNPEVPARLAVVVERMLEKPVERRYASIEEVAAQLTVLHAALRRSKGRSALPARAPAPGDDARARELVARALLEAARPEEAAPLLEEALALDPDHGEAGERIWAAHRGLRGRRTEIPPSPEQEARVASLLARIVPDAPEPEARQALAELVLLAPDDPRLAERIRERAEHDRA